MNLFHKNEFNYVRPKVKVSTTSSEASSEDCFFHGPMVPESGTSEAGILIRTDTCKDSKLDIYIYIYIYAVAFAMHTKASQAHQRKKLSVFLSTNQDHLHLKRT